jgi:hypothetical protein
MPERRPTEPVFADTMQIVFSGMPKKQTKER